MDVDGTLTDGKIYMGPDGEVCKAFNIKDGCGIRIVTGAGIVPVIITGRSSEILKRRCEELDIKEIYQSVSDKVSILKRVVDDLSTVAYIGDDVNDIACMLQVKDAGGIIGCPADAANEVKQLATFISEKPGGEGAVREFIDWIITNE